MFGLGLWEITLILIVSLLVLGPQRLPQLAKQVARFVRDIRRAATEIQMQFEEVETTDIVADGDSLLNETPETDNHPEILDDSKSAPRPKL